MHTQTHPTTDRRFVDPEELICPGCGEQVRCAPPDGHMVDGLPVPQFSHPDATALCRTRSGAVAEPVEEGVVTGQDVPGGGRRSPSGWSRRGQQSR